MASSRQRQPGVVWADHLLDVVDVAPAASSLLGVGPGEVLAIDFILAMKLLLSRALNHEDLRSTFDSLFDDVSEDLDVTLRFADAPTHLQVRAYVSPQSGFVGRLWTFDDVSAADAAENALEAANDMLRASTDSMLDPQVLLEAVRDAEGRVVDLAYRSVNRAACLFLGHEEHELVTLSQLESLANLEGSGLWETPWTAWRWGPR